MSKNQDCHCTVLKKKRHFYAMIFWVRAQFVELFFFLNLLVLRVISLFVRERPVGTHLNQRPVLLVHGYFNAAFVWAFFKRALVRKGFGPIYALSLGSPFHSISCFAQRVQKKAHQIAQETGRSDLTLVGHSMGGLVSLYYAMHHAPKDSVKQIITLGSPLKGTKLAKIALGKCAREMEIGSPLLQKLQAIEQQCSSVSIYNLGTATDQIVIPYHSCFLVTDPTRTRLFHNLGHVSLLFSPRVVDQVSAWIAKNEPF
jgi:triacylglycerol lipase